MKTPMNRVVVLYILLTVSATWANETAIHDLSNQEQINLNLTTVELGGNPSNNRTDVVPDEMEIQNSSPDSLSPNTNSDIDTTPSLTEFETPTTVSVQTTEIPITTSIPPSLNTDPPGTIPPNKEEFESSTNASVQLCDIENVIMMPFPPHTSIMNSNFMRIKRGQHSIDHTLKNVLDDVKNVLMTEYHSELTTILLRIDGMTKKSDDKTVQVDNEKTKKNCATIMEKLVPLYNFIHGNASICRNNEWEHFKIKTIKPILLDRKRLASLVDDIERKCTASNDVWGNDGCINQKAQDAISLISKLKMNLREQKINLSDLRLSLASGMRVCLEVTTEDFESAVIAAEIDHQQCL